MQDERWVLQNRATGQFRGVKFDVDGDPWERAPVWAIRYVSKEVAELAGKYLHPMTPTDAVSYKEARGWYEWAHYERANGSGY